MREYIVKWIDWCDTIREESVFGMNGLMEFLNELNDNGGNTILTIKSYYKEQ